MWRQGRIRRHPNGTLLYGTKPPGGMIDRRPAGVGPDEGRFPGLSKLSFFVTGNETRLIKLDVAFRVKFGTSISARLKSTPWPQKGKARPSRSVSP